MLRASLAPSTLLIAAGVFGGAVTWLTTPRAMAGGRAGGDGGGEQARHARHARPAVIGGRVPAAGNTSLPGRPRPAGNTALTSRLRREAGSSPPPASGGSCRVRWAAASTCSRIAGGGSVARARPSRAAASRYPRTSASHGPQCWR